VQLRARLACQQAQTHGLDGGPPAAGESHCLGKGFRELFGQGAITGAAQRPQHQLGRGQVAPAPRDSQRADLPRPTLPG
jgi:hypothetical protein